MGSLDRMVVELQPHKRTLRPLSSKPHPACSNSATLKGQEDPPPWEKKMDPK